MKKITLKELADGIATVRGTKKSETKELIESTFNSILRAVKADDSVFIIGFGTFRVKETPARKGRNPRTGETIAVLAKKKLVFVSSKGVV